MLKSTSTFKAMTALSQLEHHFGTAGQTRYNAKMHSGMVQLPMCPSNLIPREPHRNITELNKALGSYFLPYHARRPPR